MRIKKIIAVCALLGAMLFAGNTADARWGYRYYRPYLQSYRYWSQPYRWHSNHYYRVVPHGNHYHYRWR